MKRHLLLLFTMLIMGSLQAQARQNLSLKTQLFVALPEYCPTPDNIAISPKGTITLTCPNYAGKTDGVIVSIADNKEVNILAYLPGNSKMKHGRPKGLDYAPDGSLYVCNAKRRRDGEINRLTFKDGKVDSIQVVAKGINPNGLKYNKGYIYVTQPRLKKVNDSTMIGGVFRFHEDERNVLIEDAYTDPHLLFQSTNTNPRHTFGIDGLCFDTAGHLYVGEFGDATIFKLTLNSKGKLVKDEIYAQLPRTAGLDGMVMDEDINLFVVGFCSNQLFRVTSNKRIHIIAQYPDNNGAQGQLDQPVDVAWYQDKLLISNFDLMAAPGMVNTAHSKPYTISYLTNKQLKNE